jgi:hypothetical protein
MKKKYLLILALCIGSYALQGQISKESILIGGDFSVYHIDQEAVSGTEYKSNGIVFSPLIGVATRQNIIQGGYLQVWYSKNNYNINPGTTKTSNIGGGYFIRKYTVIKNNFYGFIQANAGVTYFKNKVEQNSGSSESTQASIGIFLVPGLSYRISKKLHLEAGLREIAGIGYSVIKNNSTGQSGNDISEVNQIYFNSSLDNFNANLYFGFRLLLDKK